MIAISFQPIEAGFWRLPSSPARGSINSIPCIVDFVLCIVFFRRMECVHERVPVEVIGSIDWNRSSSSAASELSSAVMSVLVAARCCVT